MKRKLMSILLSLIMVSTLLPARVLATDTEIPDFTGYYDVVNDVCSEVGFYELTEYGQDCNRGLLCDLDGDGSKELLLNTYNGESYAPYGYQLWTVHEGKTLLLMQGNHYSMTQYSYYLTEYQSEDYLVVSYGTGGTMAATTYYHFYKIGIPAHGEYEQVYFAEHTHYTGGGDEYYLNGKSASQAEYEKLETAVTKGTELPVEVEGIRLDDILDTESNVKPGEYWFQQYGQYIENHYENSEYKTGWEDDVWYYLLYIDDDDIPELWIRTLNAPFGSILLSYQDGELIELIADGEYVVYEERGGVFYLPLHRMGMGHDCVYTLSNGKLELIAKGTEEAIQGENGQLVVDSNGYLVMDYFWDGSPISKEDYQAKLNEYVDPGKAIECYPDIEHFSRTYMGQYFAHMADSLYSGTCGENLLWAFDVSTGKLTISGTGDVAYYGEEEDAPWEDIKDQIKDLEIKEGVTGIGAFAFNGSPNLESVQFPSTFESLGAFAFSNCPKLSKVDASACESAPVSMGMFMNCDRLTSLDTLALNHLPSDAFTDCDGFEVLEIPEGVTYLMGGVFSGCSCLREIIFPSTLNMMDSHNFVGCANVSVIRFKGDAPMVNEFYRPFDAPWGEEGVSPIKATAYYPAGNPTWTAKAMRDMGGELTWVPYYTEHTFGDWTKITAATCTAVGKEIRICTACGETEERDIPMLDHTFFHGTCTSCGITDPNWVEPEQPAKPVTSRLAGSHRYETAFLAADRMKANLGIEKFDAVVVASGINFADALSGSYLAAVKNAPILLASGVDWVDALVKDYIKDNLNPGGTVYILGGGSAVPEAFEDGLDGFAVNRLAGGDRFETNLLVLEEAGVGDKPVLVCTGLSFADSLSASAAELPIVLVWNSLTEDQKALLEGLNGNKLYIIGGESAVGRGMEAQLTAYGETERVAGGNRFETSVAIAETFFNAPKSAVLAYAWNFPDGLCGGPLAATMDAPLILTMDHYEIKAAEYVQGNTIKNGIILGGESLISEATVNNIFQ